MQCQCITADVLARILCADSRVLGVPFATRAARLGAGAVDVGRISAMAGVTSVSAGKAVGVAVSFTAGGREARCSAVGSGVLFGALSLFPRCGI